MSKIKLFFIFFLTNIFFGVLPWVIDFLVKYKKIGMDISYGMIYLLITPLIINIVLFIFLRNKKWSFKFLLIFIVIGYINSYFFAVNIFNNFLVNFNPTI